MDLSGNSFQDLEHTQTLLTYTGHRLGVLSLAWSPDSTRIASAGKDATLQVWNATTGETLLSCSGHESCPDYENWIWSVGWSPDGLHILSAGSDATVRLWDARTGEALLVYRGHEGPVFGRPYMVGSPPVYAAVWSPDSSRIASTSYGGTIRIWEALTGRDIVVRETLNQYIYALAWSPDGTTLAFTKWVLHEGVELWHPDSSDPSSIYRGHHYAIDDLAWSPDGVFIVSGGNGEAAQVWKSNTHELITTYCAEQPSGTGSVDWRPGGHHIASAVRDPDASLVEIWDAWTGIRCATYRGHTGKVEDVAWSPDGTRVASASEDCTVQVWSPRICSTNVRYGSNLANLASRSAIRVSRLMRKRRNGRSNMLSII